MEIAFSFSSAPPSFAGTFDESCQTNKRPSVRFYYLTPYPVWNEGKKFYKVNHVQSIYQTSLFKWGTNATNVARTNKPRHCYILRLHHRKFKIFHSIKFDVGLECECIYLVLCYIPPTFTHASIKNGSISVLR